MNLSQALKKKNKIATDLGKIMTKIQSHNSRVKGQSSPYNLEDLYEQYNTTRSELVALKTAIHAASSPVRSKIFELSELKATVRQLTNLDTTEGIKQDRYARLGSGDILEKEATFNVVWLDGQISSLEEQIDTIQDELDTFNHSTTV